MEEFAGFSLDRSGGSESNLRRVDRRLTKRRTRHGTVYKDNRKTKWDEGVLPPDLSGRASMVESVDMQNSGAASESSSQGFPVAEAVFTDFSRTAAKRLDTAFRSHLMYKVLQHGADAAFDQLLATMRTVSQFAVSAVCKRLMTWRRMQIELITNAANKEAGMQFPVPPERCQIAIDFVFCRAAIEILSRHPENDTDVELPDDIAAELTELVFRSIAPDDCNLTFQPDDRDATRLTRLFSQLLSNIARTRFALVQKRFFAALIEVEQDPYRHVSLIGSMAFADLQLYPVDKLEEGFAFLEECGNRLKSASSSKIRHAWADLLMELLTPIAAIVKSEVNLPVVRGFVDSMYQYLLELLRKSKHLSSILPLTTAILSISQKDFFQERWQSVLATCLATSKNSRTSLQEVAAESAVRLTWVYTVRSSNESNAETKAKLKLIADSFFPGGKQLAPRHLPAKVFVRLIVFMAQGHFDFTLRQVVLNLMTIDSNHKIGNFDKVAVGVRGFLVIANNQEIDDGPPLAPLLFDTLPSGHPVRPKTELLTSLLTREKALRLGLAPYLEEVQQKLLRLLQILDLQVVGAFIRTNPAMEHRPSSETLSKDRSMAMDLLKTCLIAIPRCLPLLDQSFDVILILFRCTVSLDEELRKIAIATLQTLIHDRTDARGLILWHYADFVVTRVPVSDLSLVYDCMRTLSKLLMQWKRAVLTEAEEGAVKEAEKTTAEAGQIPLVSTSYAQSGSKGDGIPVVKLEVGNQENQSGVQFRQRALSAPVKSSSPRSENRRSRHSMKKMQRQKDLGPMEAPSLENVLYMVEGVSLASLFTPDISTRTTCLFLLRQIREMREHLEIKMSPGENSVYTLIYDAVPEKYFLKRADLIEAQSAQELGSEMLVDVAGTEHLASAQGSLYDIAKLKPGSWSDDIWLACLADIVQARLIGCVNSAIEYSWLCTCERVLVLSQLLSIGDTYGHKSGAVAFMSEQNRDTANRALMANCCAISAQLPMLLCIDDDSLAAVPMSFGGQSDSFCHKRHFSTAGDYMKFIVSLLQDESHAVQELAQFSLSWIDLSSYSAFSEELRSLVQESLSLRSESTKKKKRRDRLRIVLAGVHAQTATTAGVCLRDTKSEVVVSSLAKYVTGTRSYLEMEGENDLPDLDELRLRFAQAVAAMCNNIKDLSLYSKLFTDEVRTDLFALFSLWCETPQPTQVNSGNMTHLSDGDDPGRTASIAASIRQHAVTAIGALCRGSAFDSSRSVKGSAYLLTWLEAKLASTDNETSCAAAEALLNLLEGNKDSALYAWAIQLCYTADATARQQVFLALVKVHETSSVFREHYIPNLCLALHMLADGSDETHVQARRMLALLVKEHYDGELGEEFPLIYSSAVQATRTYYQTVVGQYLAKKHPQSGLKLLPELFKHFMTTSTPRQQQLVQCIVPWLEVLDLAAMDGQTIPISSESDCDEQVPASRFLLSNLIYLYATFSTNLALGGLWKALLVNPTNLNYVIDHLVREADTRTGSFTRFAQEICTVLAEVDAESTVAILVEHMEAQLESEMHSDMTIVPSGQRKTSDSQLNVRRSSGSPANSDQVWQSYCTGLDELIPRASARVPPLFSCSLWLIGEIIARFSSFDWAQQIPTILHYACLGLDHPSVDVHLKAKTLILNLLLVSTSKLPVPSSKLEPTVSFLRDPKAPKLAVDDTANNNSDQLDLPTFLLDLCAILEPVVPGLADAWSTKAHGCATSCAICYYAGRSFQILRVFPPDRSQGSFDAMLIRLGDSVGDGATEILRYTREILLTLESLVDTPTTDVSVSMVIPNIFWTAVSLLESDLEEEFSLAVQILSRVESTGWLNRPEYVDVLATLFREFEWETNYPGFYFLLCRGLGSSLAASSSLELCRTLLPLHGHPVLDPIPDGSFTCAVVVMLISVIQGFDSRPETVCDGARAVADIAKSRHAQLVSKMFALYADDNYFRACENWTKEVCKHFAKECFPANEALMLRILVRAFISGDTQIRDSVTTILIPLIPHVSTPATFALFNEILIPKILELVNQGTVVMSALVDAIASACARADKKSPTPHDGPIDKLCDLFNCKWDRSGGQQQILRNRIKLILKTLGFISVSQVKFLRLSIDSSSSAMDDAFSRDAMDSISPVAHEKVSENGESHPDLDASEERFFEDFDFLDDELAGTPVKVRHPDTTIDSDVESDGVGESAEPWKRRAPSLDGAESETSNLLSMSAAMTGSMPDTLASSVFTDTSNGSSSPLSKPSNSLSSSDLLESRQKRQPLALTAENLKSLSHVSLSSSTRSAEDLPHEPAQELLDSYVHVDDASALNVFGKHVDAFLLDTDPDSSKMIWAIARNAVVATLKLHQKFVTQELSQLEFSLLPQVRAMAEAFINELTIPYVFVDAVLMRNTDLVDSMRMLVLELHTVLDTYRIEQDDCATKLLELLHLSRTSSIGSIAEYSKEIQVGTWNIVRLVTKMHLDILAIVSVYGRFVDITKSLVVDDHITNFSTELRDHMSSIELALKSSEEVQAKRIDTSSLSKLRAIQYLQDNLGRKRVKQSISLLRAFRKSWPADVFGQDESDDMNVLMSICANTQCYQGTECIGVASTSPSIEGFRLKYASSLVQNHKMAVQQCTHPVDEEQVDDPFRESPQKLTVLGVDECVIDDPLTLSL